MNAGVLLMYLLIVQVMVIRLFRDIKHTGGNVKLSASAHTTRSYDKVEKYLQH